jgi:hypothetical protein
VDLTKTLLGIEQGAWQSLVDGEGRSYLRGLLADDAQVIGLGGAVVTGPQALEVLSGQSWSWFRLRGPRLLQLGEDAALLTYRVIARRDFDSEYQAVVTSAYRRADAGWTLVAVQHTPV